MMLRSYIYIVGVISVFLVPTCLAQIDCTDLPDGSYGHGCQSYTNCTGGVEHIVNCDLPTFAYDHRTGKCEYTVTVPPPCGSIDNDCSDKTNGRYPILPECLYYFTCINNVFFGSNPCNADPSGTLVFDKELDVCNWPFSVPPPCGTRAP